MNFFAAILCFALLSLCPLTGAALSFPLPENWNDVVGEIKTVTARYEDTFSDIGRAHDLGYNEMVDANPGVDPWLPGEGTEIILPTRFILPPGPREGIVINLAELRLYYYPPGENRIVTHPLGIGREGWSTPTGQARVTGKKQDPSWRPPESIRREHADEGRPLPAVVEAGPENPLGQHAIYLSMTGYLLHGTNKPYGVGMRVSHGCIRLYPEDISSLFAQVPVNTPVRIINEPYKVGWQNGKLFIEAHKPLTEQQIEHGHDFTPLIRKVVTSLGLSTLQPDWETVKSAAESQRGYPVPIAVAGSATTQDQTDSLW